MSTISIIRREIYKASPDHIFTTREFLAFGLRAVVDQSLSRLVKRGLIVRIARGLFIKEGASMPSIEKVAERKAEAFGKSIKKHCADLARELGLSPRGNQEPTFVVVNGRSSSFCFGAIRIHFKGIGPRKLKLADSKAGEVMRALWHLGENICDRFMIMKAVKGFNRLDRMDINSAPEMMPAWLTSKFAWRWQI